jgi:hypothetical protein
MALRGIPQGGVPIGMMNAIAGTPSVVSLTAQAAGNSQNGYIVPSDMVYVTAANGSNLTLTLPDPNKYGGAVGDQFQINNANSGQTLAVYPPTGGNIDGAGSNASVSISSNASGTFHLVSWTATTSVWFNDGGS